MQRSAATGPLTAIIDQHLAELANGIGFSSGHRPDGGVVSKPQGLTPSRGGSSLSPPPAGRGRGSGAGAMGSVSARRPSPRRSSPSSAHRDEAPRPPRPKSPEPKLPKSRAGPAVSSSVPRTMKKAQSEKSLRDPMTPGPGKSGLSGVLPSWTSVKESSSTSKAGKEKIDDPSFASSTSRFQPVRRPNVKGRVLDSESFLHDRLSSERSLERSEWLQLELSEMQRRHEELERHSERNAVALADMVLENDRLKTANDELLKEKAQMEEVFEQIKEQRREEKAVTELRHEREKQDLKQEILNLKALVKQQMERQEEAVKRTALARKSDKRNTHNVWDQLCQMREQNRVGQAQHNEEMHNLTQDLARTIKERDLLAAQLRAVQKQLPPGVEDDLLSTISSAWEPIGDSGSNRKEVATLKFKVLALKRALFGSKGNTAQEAPAQSTALNMPATSIMEMLAQEREAMERKYSEHFALLMSAVGRQQTPHSIDRSQRRSHGSSSSRNPENANSDRDDRTQGSRSGPSSPTVFDIEAPSLECNGDPPQKMQGSVGSLSTGSYAGAQHVLNPVDMLSQLRRENQEVRRRYGI